MHLSKLQASKIAFSAILLLSLILFAKGTVNYVGAFAALNNFELRALNINLVTSPENFSVIVNLEVSNPTWYDGLHLQSIISTLSYEGENHTVIVSAGGPMVGTPYQAIVTPWWNLPEKEVVVNSHVPPHSVTKIQMHARVTGEAGIRFHEFYEKQGKHQEYILWKLESYVYLAVPTFLDSIGLEYQFYLKSNIA